MFEKMEKKLQNIFGKNAHINSVRFFESKKNQVTLIESETRDWLKSCNSLKRIATLVPVPQASVARFQIIMKTFIWGERKKEEEILKKLYELGVSVPKIIKSEKDILFLEYIPGENLRTLYNKEKNPYTNTARKYDAMIASWLGNFHKKFEKNGKVLLKGDMHLQNFIFQPISSPHRGEGRVRGILFGVDFEEASYGAPEYDLAQLFAVFSTQILRAGGRPVGQTFRFADIKKHKKRVDNFIKIYSKISGININKNFDKLIKQELIKISKYMPHLKDSCSLLVARC